MPFPLKALKKILAIPEQPGWRWDPSGLADSQQTGQIFEECIYWNTQIDGQLGMLLLLLPHTCATMLPSAHLQLLPNTCACSFKSNGSWESTSTIYNWINISQVKANILIGNLKPKIVTYTTWYIFLPTYAIHLYFIHSRPKWTQPSPTEYLPLKPYIHSIFH